MNNYSDFLQKKFRTFIPSGFDVQDSDINFMLFDFQVDIVKWALRLGKSAIFADCGLGKTFMQIEWARLVHERTKKNVLILAPLAVSQQTRREGEKLGVEVYVCKEQSHIRQGINITNYERIEKFDLSSFVGIVLDESSILKSYSGATRTLIINSFLNTPYKLACTATPAPNDFMELGNHAEFLNVMTRVEMLATYFVHDSNDTSQWRLKGHVRDNIFWDWMTTWAVVLSKPSDLGYDDDGFVLPELKIKHYFIESEWRKGDGFLFVQEAAGLHGRRKARRESLSERVVLSSKMVNSSDENWICWCDLNQESDELKKAIDGAVEVKGADSIDHKEKSLVEFADNQIKCMVTKPSIAGHGMNWQNCSNIIFVGLSDSYEMFYQAVRRCWRFGQKNPVNVYVVMSDRERSVMKNIERKGKDFQSMIDNMSGRVKLILEEGRVKGKELQENYEEKVYEGKGWELWHGDCVEVSRQIEDNSIDYTIFSPPFLSLYVYSDSIRDMGNCRDEVDFMEHFGFLMEEMFRVTKPGRLVTIHCSDIPAMKERDGYMGLKDFPGKITVKMEERGFIYHSKCVIWKDPLLEAVRTKAIGLLHKQLVKDSVRCRHSLPDYLITFLKPGENQNPVSHGRGFERYIGSKEDPKAAKDDDPAKNRYSQMVFRRYADPIWMDIRQTRTLNYRLAREDEDERHICALQLDVIERCLEYWSNPGDLIFSPFAGVGSELYCSVKMDRRALGIELKESYVDLAVKNLEAANREKRRRTLL